MAAIVRMILHKWFPPAQPTTAFTGKIVIVTGANIGLGLEAATKFVELGASKVILGVRTIQKGEDAKMNIERRTGRKDCIEVWSLDMNSYDSIRAFAQKASEFPHVDIAVLNAGVQTIDFRQSAYGWEEMLQVNVLSTAYLGLHLLPKLKASRTASETPVLEIVGSGTHSRVSLMPEEQNAEHILQAFNDPSKEFNSMRQYSASKLFVMYAVQTLAKMAEDSSAEPQVIVTTVCPGVTRSALGRHFDYSLVNRIGKFIFYALFARSTEAGSRTLVSGATLGKESHGRFWQHDKFQPSAPLVSGEQGEELRKQVWHEIIDALRKDAPDTLQFAGTI